MYKFIHSYELRTLMLYGHVWTGHFYLSSFYLLLSLVSFYFLSILICIFFLYFAPLLLILPTNFLTLLFFFEKFGHIIKN